MEKLPVSAMDEGADMFRSIRFGQKRSIVWLAVGPSERPPLSGRSSYTLIGKFPAFSARC